MKVYGKGINDVDYTIEPTIKGKKVRCQIHRTWRNMLERCYCEKWVQRYPTYIGCKVCDEWLIFSNFKIWMEKQDWKGKQLDKDLLGDGKLYSPETCCFVEQWLNKLFTDHAAKRGEWPIGVYYRKDVKRFKSHLSIDGHLKHIGYFDSPEEAHTAYLEAKKKYVQEKMENYPDQRIKKAILEKVKIQ